MPSQPPAIRSDAPVIAWRPLSDALRCVLEGVAARLEASNTK